MSSIAQQQVPWMFMSATRVFIVRVAAAAADILPDDLTPDEIMAIEEFRNANDIESTTLDDLLEELKVE